MEFRLHSNLQSWYLPTNRYFDYHSIGFSCCNLSTGIILLTYFVVQLHDANFKPMVIIWKPFKLVFKGLYHQWDTTASIVDCFSSFMLLSSVKLLNVCFDILIPVEVITILSTPENMTRNWRVYYDASIPYFSNQHLPYAFIAILVLVTNILAPTLILLLYPFSTCQRFLNTFPHRWQLTCNTHFCGFLSGLL